MACCFLGVFFLAQAFAVWRWFARHGRHLLVGLLLTFGVVLTASGAAALWTDRGAELVPTLLDICRSA